MGTPWLAHTHWFAMVCVGRFLPVAAKFHHGQRRHFACLCLQSPRNIRSLLWVDKVSDEGRRRRRRMMMVASGECGFAASKLDLTCSITPPSSDPASKQVFPLRYMFVQFRVCAAYICVYQCKPAQMFHNPTKFSCHPTSEDTHTHRVL